MSLVNKNVVPSDVDLVKQEAQQIVSKSDSTTDAMKNGHG